MNRDNEQQFIKSYGGGKNLKHLDTENRTRIIIEINTQK